MHVLDPGIIIPDLIVGSIASIGGVFIVVFRRQLRDWVVSSEKVRFGERRGQALGLLQTPFWTGTTGVLIVLLGVTTITYGVVALVQHVSGA